MGCGTKASSRSIVPAGLLAILAFAAAAGAAHAQQPSQAQLDAIRQSCRSDFMANCAGVQPGGRDALQCLQRNTAKLSGACKAAVSAITPPPAAPAPAAASPAPSPTATPTTSPAPAPAATAPAPAATSAPAARSAPTAKHRPSSAQLDAIRRACRSDFMANCAGVQPGGPEALQCLQRKSAALSPACRTAVGAVSRGAPKAG